MQNRKECNWKYFYLIELPCKHSGISTTQRCEDWANVFHQWVLATVSMSSNLECPKCDLYFHLRRILTCKFVNVHFYFEIKNKMIRLTNEDVPHDIMSH